jgi:hypothetical protein
MSDGKDKIYRRSTQLGDTPIKKKDEKARKRNNILNFRATPTEKSLIERRIELSGLDRASFFIQSCMYQKVLVRGNIKSFDKIKKRMDELEEKLVVPTDISDLPTEERETIRMILEILDKLYGSKNRLPESEELYGD